MDRYPALARSVRVQRLRTARTVGRRTRYRAQASSARPITVRICCSDHRVCLETGFATAPPTLPGRPARADSPSAVTNDESFDTFESFVFDAIACSYPRRPASNQGSAPFCEEKDRVERAKEDDREMRAESVLCLPQLPVRFARNARATIPAETKSLTPGIPVPRDVCRRSLTLGYYGETIVLVDDPLDVTDEVIRHDGELS